MHPCPHKLNSTPLDLVQLKQKHLLVVLTRDQVTAEGAGRGHSLEHTGNREFNLHSRGVMIKLKQLYCEADQYERGSILQCAISIWIFN